MSDLYERDFYAWANEQAALLREGRLSVADIANIAEEIESMGRSEKRELVNRLDVLLLHLLKWQYQPERRGASWRVSIENTRDALTRHMTDNPSLKAKLPEAVADAYRTARRSAAVETGLELDTFPAGCPWTFEQAMDEGFWPGATQPPPRSTSA
jgi:predicted  nucleic acid-binding Zn-ribbon protein